MLLQWTVPCAKDHALFSPGNLRRVPGRGEHGSLPCGRPAWICKRPFIPLSNSLVRVEFSRKYGNMGKNLGTPCDAVPGTRYAQTRYAQTRYAQTRYAQTRYAKMSCGERPTVAVLNFFFLARSK